MNHFGLAADQVIVSQCGPTRTAHTMKYISVVERLTRPDLVCSSWILILRNLCFFSAAFAMALAQRTDERRRGLSHMAKEYRRSICYTNRVETGFGSMYVHLEIDPIGRLTGISISHPSKNPTSQITELIDKLSKTLDDCAKSAMLDSLPSNFDG